MSVFALKVIALISMAIDHIGAVFDSVSPTFIYFRAIGRISFPIYAFLISEGCIHSKNMNKYTLRLAAFALISEIPFDLALSAAKEINFFKSTNIFYTLCLGVTFVNIYEFLKNKLTSPDIAPNTALIIAIAAASTAPALAYVLDTDYGIFGVVWIFTLYLARTKNMRILTLLAGIMFLYGLPAISHLFYQFQNISRFAINFEVSLFLCAILSVAFVALYNGRKGMSLKWIFYLFYPLHLLALAFFRPVR